mgnify:CR=1 FL=1
MGRYKLTIQECSSGYEGHNHLEKIIDLGFEGKLRIARRGGKEGDDQMVEIEMWIKRIKENGIGAKHRWIRQRIIELGRCKM